jgi:hypothetical protein
VIGDITGNAALSFDEGEDLPLHIVPISVSEIKSLKKENDEDTIILHLRVHLRIGCNLNCFLNKGIYI